MERKALTNLQRLSRQVVGARKPWDSKDPERAQGSDETLLLRLRLARDRQIAGVQGQRTYSRKLLRLELGLLSGDGSCCGPAIDVVELLVPTAPARAWVHVAGVARPIAHNRLAVGDPGSGTAVEAVSLDAHVPRGAPVEVAGEWNADRGCLCGALLLKCGSFDKDLPQERTVARCRTQETTSQQQVVDLFETAYARSRLSLDTLCSAHKLLVDVSKQAAGKLRDGPAVLRLFGWPPFLLPPPDEALISSKEFLRVLARHLSADTHQVQAPILAAEAIARFTDLHPFADGNGRVARGLATWLLMRAGYKPKPNISLGDFCSLHRNEQYRALRQHETDPWSWHQFFFDAVLTCFLPP